MTDKVRVITEEQYREYMELKNQTNKEVKRWKPIDGDLVWVIYNDGAIEETTYLGDIDEHRLNTGSCFKTKEEAQKGLDRRLAEQELLSHCDFDGRVALCYDEHAECFEADDTSEFPYYHSPYRFASKESCQKAIDTLGAEKLKLIFRID